MTDETLTHYASEYYDPAKAREYYLRNRDLKGNKPPQNETTAQRKARVATSRNQREAIGYANKQIGAKKQAESKQLQAAQQARLEKLRTNAEASRARIEEKLNKLLSELKAKANIPEPPPVKQTPLNKIPYNASPQRREYLEKQNALITKSNKEASDKAAADFASKKATANREVAEASTKARSEARAEMKRIGTEMKLAVSKARDSYMEAKNQLTTKYKTVSDAEEKNIKANVR